MVRVIFVLLLMMVLGSCGKDDMALGDSEWQSELSGDLLLQGRSSGFYDLDNSISGARLTITQQRPEIATMLSTLTSYTPQAVSLRDRFTSAHMPVWQWARVVPMTTGVLYRVPVYDDNFKTSAILSIHDSDHLGVQVVNRKDVMLQLLAGEGLSVYDNVGVNVSEFALFDYYARVSQDVGMLAAVSQMQPLSPPVAPCEDCEVYSFADKGDEDNGGDDSGDNGGQGGSSGIGSSILDQWQTSSGGGSSGGGGGGSTGSQGGNTGSGNGTSGGSVGGSLGGSVTVGWNPNTNSVDVISHTPPAGVDVDMQQLMTFIFQFINWQHLLMGGFNIEIEYEIVPGTDQDDANTPVLVLKDKGLVELNDALQTIGAVPGSPVVGHVYIDCGQDDVVGSGVSTSEGVAQAALSWNDLFNISCDKLKCLLENQDLFDAVAALASSDMIDPCDPSKTPEDFLGEIIDNMGEDCSLEGFEAALAGVDKIVPDPTFDNCEKVKCVYDLLDVQNNGLFCSTFGELFDSEVFTLELFSVPRSSLSWNADGATSFNGNNIAIKIADDLCSGETHPLDIASTLLHEAIHAAMYQSALNGNPNLNSTDYCLIWQDHFQTNDPCHEVMANQYVELLAQAIADLDGNRFSLDYYMYSAWAGLSNVGEQVGLLADPYVSQYYDQYQSLINSPFDECR